MEDRLEYFSLQVIFFLCLYFMVIVDMQKMIMELCKLVPEWIVLKDNPKGKLFKIQGQCSSA